MKGKKNDLPKDLSFSHSSWVFRYQALFNSFLKQPRSSLEKHTNFSKTNTS